jgi:importin subunit beta-1
VAAIAEIELLHGQWPDLVHILLDNVTATDNVNLKQATLKTIGYICEGVVSKGCRVFGVPLTLAIYLFLS